ncbi:hypothetical protein ACI01nite_12770 [Acetobacter cibinongensis]|uniref:Uncharacterized protein n=1 Tax=Acetobacter cibinongensis TaxID=146475 RepID=A0A0D6N499_9PROT|nr:hypothetical protein [Acetobacter cibinongensis]GAN60827.1 hypothetical protein Abci_017_011 [Acetobacter cibinongensis]GBQ13497.1 hypothetical protein AA0482_0622 [Acetobacter cibinongensis NRIC 0482]GEL58675.1 hypothetical protein ACI01nite_12770 [Acetobacter cibinongensis]
MIAFVTQRHAPSLFKREGISSMHSLTLILAAAAIGLGLSVVDRGATPDLAQGRTHIAQYSSVLTG